MTDSPDFDGWVALGLLLATATVAASEVVVVGVVSQHRKLKTTPYRNTENKISSMINLRMKCVDKQGRSQKLVYGVLRLVLGQILQARLLPK